MMGLLKLLPLGLGVLLGGMAGAQAQPAGPSTTSTGIFSCIDAHGRKLTSDRPLPECNDREQRELNPSGTTRRLVEPAYTAREQAQREASERETRQRELRLIEERRRERVLVMRYPDASAHWRSRQEGLSQIDVVIRISRQRLDQLALQRKAIEGEIAFYEKDPGEVPASLRRVATDNLQSEVLQKRFLDQQEAEKKRVNARFDEEETLLKPLWAAGHSSH